MFHVDKAAVRGVEGHTLREADKRDRFWWHYPGLRSLNFLLLGCIVCDMTNGYDGSMLNGLQSLPSWQDALGHPKGTRLGTISNGTRYGQLAALLVAAPLIQWLGPRRPITIGSLLLLIGVALQAGAQNYAMFVFARCLIGFGNTIQNTACPILASELAHPFQRTQIIGIQNTTGSLGQIMAAWITYGTSFIVSSWSWRLPSLLQATSSCFQLVMSFFMPESPRWLVYQNRSKEAYEILAKYHAEGDESSELLQYEMAEIEAAIEAEKVQALSSWMGWFRSSANRYRLFIIVTSGFIIQWCGNALLSYYIHLVFNSIGITNNKQQLLLNGGITINGWVWGNLFSLFIDKIGRRPMWLIGMSGMFVAFLLLTVFTGVNTGLNYENHALGRATIFTIFLFGVFYKMPGCMLNSYVAEVAPFDLRAKAFVISSFGDAAANIFSGYTNPIGLGAIGWKYYIAYSSNAIARIIACAPAKQLHGWDPASSYSIARHHATHVGVCKREAEVRTMLQNRLAALLYGDIVSLNGNTFHQTAPVIEQQGRFTQEDATGYRTRDSSLTSISQAEHHRPKRQRINDGDYDTLEAEYWDADNVSWIPPLPPVSFLEAVVEAHFQTVHHWVPILHETRFRAKFKDPMERQKLPVLLHALLSASIKYVDFENFGMSIQDVAKQIRVSRRAVMSHAMESLSIQNTQALVIIAFDYMGSGHIAKTWPIIGSLTRVVDYLQLSVEPDEESPKRPLLKSVAILNIANDWTESEERRRLFWSVFLLDRWHTSLTSDDVHRRLPCGGAMWARSEPVSTPYFGIWDKATAKIGNSISNAPTIYLSPKTVADHPTPGSNSEVDVSKLGAFAYCIEATENLSQVTSFFLQQGVDFDDRDAVKSWLTRFKELDLRLVHWKMFLPKQWQDSNVSRDSLVIKMDPNLTLAHISHNTSTILLHQHVAYPPTGWKDVVKLPSSCSAETCHLAAVETACIVQKYLRYMGGIVNSQFTFCAFAAARVLLVHWHSGETRGLDAAFFDLLQCLKDMSDKWRGYYKYPTGISDNLGQERQGRIKDLPSRYVEQLEHLHGRFLNDVAFSTMGFTDILRDASLYHYTEESVHDMPVPTGQTDHGNPARVYRRYSSGFEAYQNAGVPSPTRRPDHQSSHRSGRSPIGTRHSAAYEIRNIRRPLEGMALSSQSEAEQSPITTSPPNEHRRALGNSVHVLAEMNAAENYSHAQPLVTEEDELTTMSNMLLENQFLEMDRVITLQSTDFFNFDSTGRVGLSG
ncbi:sugar transporter domain-containing protein [Trichoderma austrokoningii]